MATETRIALVEGNLKRNLLKMSVPTMLGFAMQSVYDIVDIIWIGRLNPSAVAGVTIFSTIFWMVDILNEIIGVSSISLISQSYGSGDMEKTRKSIEQTFTFKALVAIIASVIMLMVLNPLLNFFTTDQGVVKSALDYGYIRIFFLPIMFSSFTVNTALRCLGDAKSPMYIMGFASILNIILDPLLMFEVIPGTSIPGLGMGVFGAAVATVISTVVAFAVGFGMFFTKRSKVRLTLKGIWSLNWEIDKKLITIGLPSGVEGLFRQFSGLLTLKFISLYGTATVAALGIGNRIFGFAFMPLIGFAMGGSAIVGQCLGANNIERAKETARFATLINVVLMVGVSIVTWIFPRQFMMIFINSPEVIEVGVPMIRIFMPALIGAGISFGLGTVFSGAGYNIPHLVSSIVSRWLVQLPLLYVFVTLLKLPVEYVWATYLLAEVANVVVVLVAYKQGKWETNRV